jgi:membrane protease YdiL (CAAX protease family)
MPALRSLRWLALAIIVAQAHAFLPASGFSGQPVGRRAARAAMRYSSRRRMDRLDLSSTDMQKLFLGHCEAAGRRVGASPWREPSRAQALARRRTLALSASPDGQHAEPGETTDLPSLATDLHRRENDAGSESADELFYSGTCFEFGLAGLAVVIGKLLDVNALGAGFELSPWALGAGLLWTLPPLAFVSSIRLLDLEQLKEIEAITKEFAQKLFVDRSNAQLALFCFAAGFGEELLFRGVLHQKLEILFGSFFPAAAAVAVGFGAAHFLTPAYFVISGLSSFIFSFMFASSGSNIVVPIVSHAVYDFIALKMTLDELNDTTNNPTDV